MISASDGKVTTLGEAVTDGSEGGGRKQGGPGTRVVDWLTTLLRTFSHQPSRVIAAEAVSRKISPSRKSYFDSARKSRFQSQPSGI